MTDIDRERAAEDIKVVRIMMESCSRFIDFAQIDVLPMSEYLIKPLARP